MTGTEFIAQAEVTLPNAQTIAQAESVYGKIDNDFVKKILSVTLADNFLESDDVLRFLNQKEILSAPQEFKIDFKREKLIPFFDAGDNDFIVYHIDSNQWSFMNITDGTCFSATDSLAELLG